MYVQTSIKKKSLSSHKLVIFIIRAYVGIHVKLNNYPQMCLGLHILYTYIHTNIHTNLGLKAHVCCLQLAVNCHSVYIYICTHVHECINTINIATLMNYIGSLGCNSE